MSIAPIVISRFVKLEIDLNIINTVILGIGLFIGLISLSLAYKEYKKSVSLKKFQIYREYVTKMEKNMDFQNIFSKLEKNEKLTNDKDYDSIKELLGFYEDLALQEQSNTLQIELLWYRFGYYALKLRKHQNFNEIINEKGIYWKLFILFVEKLEIVENKSQKNTNFLNKIKL